MTVENKHSHPVAAELRRARAGILRVSTKLAYAANEATSEWMVKALRGEIRGLDRAAAMLELRVARIDRDERKRRGTYPSLTPAVKP